MILFNMNPPWAAHAITIEGIGDKTMCFIRCECGIVLKYDDPLESPTQAQVVSDLESTHEMRALEVWGCGR